MSAATFYTNGKNYLPIGLAVIPVKRNQGLS